MVKVATVVPGNGALGLPAVNGVVTLFDDVTGVPKALIDFHLVTKWKTAGDSLLSARWRRMWRGCAWQRIWKPPCAPPT